MSLVVRAGPESSKWCVLSLTKNVAEGPLIIEFSRDVAQGFEAHDLVVNLR